MKGEGRKGGRKERKDNERRRTEGRSGKERKVNERRRTKGRSGKERKVNERRRTEGRKKGKEMYPE